MAVMFASNLSLISSSLLSRSSSISLRLNCELMSEDLRRGLELPSSDVGDDVRDCILGLNGVKVDDDEDDDDEDDDDAGNDGEDCGEIIFLAGVSLTDDVDDDVDDDDDEGAEGAEVDELFNKSIS